LLLLLLGMAVWAQAPVPNFNLESLWVKHDRSVQEVFLVNVSCVACCLPTNPYSTPSAPDQTCMPKYAGAYLSGPLKGHRTFNVTATGDLMSGTGEYRNFASSSGTVWCPAPFAWSLHDDTNVALIVYGATFGTKCGDYTGDSARYYRYSLLFQ